MNKNRLFMGVVALTLGCALNYFGDRLLGVQIELFRGLQGFGGWWFVDMFVLPFFVGMLVAAIFGFGGKWLCYFPPLIVRSISYYEISHMSGVPQGASLIPMGWWGFFVILTIESAAFGGILGEIVIKRTYGRSVPLGVNKEISGESDLKA